MWFDVDDPIMLHHAKSRWRDLPLCDRVVLSLAFQDAMAHPDRVADYKWEYCRLRTGAVVVIHQFRLGFSNFTIITFGTSVFIYDLWVDPEIALAAE